MRWLLIVSFFAFLAACSENKDRPETGYDGGADGGGGPVDRGVLPDGGETNPDATENPDADVDAGADAGVMPPPRDPNCPAAAEWVTTVKGRIVDDQGNASVGSKAQLCVRTSPSGMLLCLRPEDSEATGNFTIDVPAVAACMDEATMRFVRPLEDTAASYCHLNIAGGANTVDVANPFRIYATQPATVIPPEGNIMMQRTVEFADGLEMDIIPNDYFPGSGVYGDLAASRVNIPANDTCTLAGEAMFDGAYALSPEGDLRNRTVVRMPNTSGLAANSRVNVYVMGGLGCTLDTPDMLPEGSWTQIEDGTVSGDGSTITVTPGVPCISWIAYRGQ